MIMTKSGPVKTAAVKPDHHHAVAILQVAASLSEGQNLWAHVWTYLRADAIVWLCENGYLRQHGDDGTTQFYGFSSADLAPNFRITKKGKGVLLAHGHGAHLPLEGAA